MRSIKAIWDLLRLEHGFMYALGVVVGIVVSSGLDFNFEHAFFGILTAIFCQASAFALNDYLDYEVDLANRRFDRPLVRGDLSRNSALLIGIVLAPLGFLSAYAISLNAFLLAFAITLLGYIYNVKLKEFGLLGNLYIAFSMCAPFIFGSVVATNAITPQIAILSLIAFLSGVAREIMKGIECLNCGSKNDKQSFRHNKIILQQCDQCPAYVTTKNYLFDIFHFFGSSFKDLSEHYLDSEIHEKKYSTLYKGNYVSDDKNLAYFNLNELNDALITFNQSTIDNFEKNWWFPTKLRNQAQQKSIATHNAIAWTTFITMALVCLGIAIFGKENTFSFSILFSPIIIIFFGLTYAFLNSIFEK